MKFKKSPSLPEPTLERRLHEIQILAQDRSVEYMQKIIGITSGLMGYIHAKDISFNDNSYYTFLLATIPLCQIIQHVEIMTRAKEFVDKNGMVYLNNISPSSPQEQHWLTCWKQRAEYLQSISAQKAKFQAITRGTIQGTKDLAVYGGGGVGIGYVLGYVSNLILQ